MVASAFRQSVLLDAPFQLLRRFIESTCIQDRWWSVHSPASTTAHSLPTPPSMGTTAASSAEPSDCGRSCFSCNVCNSRRTKPVDP